MYQNLNALLPFKHVLYGPKIIKSSINCTDVNTYHQL